MMSRHFLSVYSIQLRSKRKEDVQLLGADERGQSFHSLFGTFLASLSSHQKVAALKTLQRSETAKQDSTDWWGRLHAGEFGYGAEGVDVTTLKKSYTRSVDDAELIPLYFRLHAPDQAGTAVLILQRFGNRGVYTSLISLLREHVKSQYPNLMLDVERVVPAEVIAALRDGKLTAISVRLDEVPKDIADKFSYLGNVRKGSVRLQFMAEKGDSFLDPPWLKKVRSNQIQLAKIPTPADGEPSDISFTLRSSGRARTFRMGNTESIMPYVDVTDDVALDADGHPTLKSIDKVARELLAETVVKLGTS